MGHLIIEGTMKMHRCTYKDNVLVMVGVNSLCACLRPMIAAKIEGSNLDLVHTSPIHLVIHYSQNVQ